MSISIGVKDIYGGPCVFFLGIFGVVALGVPSVFTLGVTGVNTLGVPGRVDPWVIGKVVF